MKKNGFTLIELLAVIVILAIIALIATPIILGIINDAKKESQERSAELYLSALDLAIARRNLTGEFSPEECTITQGVVTCAGYEEPLVVEVDGEVPVSGTIKFENNKAAKDTTLTFEGFSATINEEGKLELSDGTSEESEEDKLILCSSTNPTPQPLFSFSTGEMEEVIVGTQATNDDPFIAGNEYLCNLGDGNRTFYVIKEEESTVTFIMNENIDGYVAYAPSGDNTAGPVMLNGHLASEISDWNKLREANGIVEIPSGYLIAEALGNSNWNATDSVDFSNQNWLRVNLGTNSNQHQYYWTATAFAHHREPAWVFNVNGTLELQSSKSSAGYGVRPIITISKENIKI